VNVDALSVKRVVIIGLGSMGQPISTQLARHGVGTQAPGRLRLIDGDRAVEERNLIGTE
jgi:3-hydroxyisobutyrate dehydrogenase-like beta-hydroxyacid dehydrogenase